MGEHYGQLTLEERCTIARLREDGQSIRQIAAALDRAPSTISRELRRNLTYGRGLYQPGHADDQAWSRRWQGSRLERHPGLQSYVLNRLAMGWSPEQVAGRMARENHSIRISHESIYRFIYAQYARTKDGIWRRYLPRAKFKRGFRGRKGGSSVKHFRDRASIHHRPKEAETRRSCGHWEADLMMMSDKKHNLLVVQERQSRYAFLQWQTHKYSEPLMANIIDRFHSLPRTLRQSMTFDNGTEFASHYRLKKRINIATYFCDPHKPWQKGGVENLNGRLRRYLPRSTKPEDIDQADILLLQNIINTTPRKCLGFQTPHEVFCKALHFKCESTSPLSRG